jgi:hypothetical protein
MILIFEFEVHFLLISFVYLCVVVQILSHESYVLGMALNIFGLLPFLYEQLLYFSCRYFVLPFIFSFPKLLICGSFVLLCFRQFVLLCITHPVLL